MALRAGQGLIGLPQQGLATRESWEAENESMSDQLSDSGKMRAALCRACASRPRDVAGHDRLLFVTVAPDRTGPVTVFRCSDCVAEWAREYTGQGRFEWILERIGRSERA